MELSFNISSEILELCDGLISTINNFYVNIDRKLNNLAATEFMQYLSDHLKSISGEIDYKESIHHRKLT